MTDLEKTIDDLKLLNSLCHGTVLDDAIALLTWQPQIVRCKDCKYYDSFSQECRNGLDGIFTGEWFCADGVKRDGD